MRIAALCGGEWISGGDFAGCIDSRLSPCENGACREGLQEGSPMMEKTAQSVANLGYHAHIYYDPATTRADAERVCAALGETFRVEIDGFRDTPDGPHPIANVLVIFKPEQFAHVVPYLMLNRTGLDVLVHPLTTDAVEDHSSY
ncbi:MAG: hypothetical protein JO161_08575, partial [Planctomycetaceae bacterium]|nr:hypothetical protein [Planctomycetaceae bacterium]